MTAAKRIAATTFLAGCLIFLSAANAAERPHVSTARWDGSWLTLNFGTPMLTWPGRNEIPSITIQPAYDCQWTWSDDTTLYCSPGYTDPNRKPGAATRYTVAVRGDLWSQQGTEIQPQTLIADTQRPTVTATVASWKQGLPIIDLMASRDVSRTELQAHLQASLDNGSPVSFSLEALHRESANVYWDTEEQLWRLTFDPSVRTEGLLRLSITPGLRSMHGDLPGDQDKVLLRAVVNERFRVRNIGCGEAWHMHWTKHLDKATIALACSGGEPIVIDFSKPLSAEAVARFRAALPRHVRFLKAADNQYDSHRNTDKAQRRAGYYILASVDTAHIRRRIEIPSSLTTADGERIARPQSLVIDSLDFLTRSNLRPARLVLPLRSDTPRIIAGINMNKAVVNQREVGGDKVLARHATLPGGRRNRLVQLAPPTPDRDIRRNGGLVDGVVRVEPAGSPLDIEHFRLAYAAFNVTAVQAGHHQLIAWVTEWDKATPVAGATIELLRIRQPDGIDTLAEARTDADGVAVVDVPQTPTHQNDGGLMVRATSGRRRAIVPLTSAIGNAPWARGHAPGEPVPRFGWDDGDEVVSWGVTDRPLYKPGDTVKYRLWVRRRDANHLVAPRGLKEFAAAVEPAGGENALAKFRVKLDAFDGASGTFHLSAHTRDGTYCIASAKQQFGLEPIGACFQVAGYHVNELWAELHANRQLAREGDTIALDASGGYYSGGPAAGMTVGIESLLMPLYLTDAYPAYSDFTFIDPYRNTAGVDGEQFSGALPRVLHTDRQGRVHVDVALTDPRLAQRLSVTHKNPIPFGKLEFTASMTNGANSTATSAPATLRFSRYARFVGLKIDPWVLRTDAEPRLEAVVITAKGKSVPGATVRVDIDEMPETGDDDHVLRKAIAHCELRAGKATPCAFRPPHTGLYRFRASSKGAADTWVERYAMTGVNTKTTAIKDRANLTTPRNTVDAGSALHVVLTQPFAKARALMTISHGRVLKHWVLDLNGPVTEFDVPTRRAWQPGFTLGAAVLDAQESAFSQYPGKLLAVAHLDIGIKVPAPKPALSLALDRDKAHPGDDISISLQNNLDRPVQVTLAVVDDANRALVPEVSALTDPHGQWLEQLRQWKLPTWYGLGDWTRRAGLLDSPGHIESLFKFLDDNISYRRESIIVTGSKIAPADIFPRGSRSDHSLGLPMRHGRGPATAALRSDFAETAAWQPAIVIDANAERSVRVHLPDNLTRWRVLAWSADKGDRFDLAEKTVEAMLPIELRSDAPTRLFPGDRARVSVSVRNHSESSKPIAATLTASGAGVERHAKRSSRIPANEQRLLSVTARPSHAGSIKLVARARRGTERDGIAAQVQVASPVIRQRLPVAGWLDSGSVRLKLPALPAGASHPRLVVVVDRGVLALAKTWVVALRDYPHRCWEQILSRAVGAAVAKKVGLGNAWPDADTAISEALESAAQFQDSTGAFHYFVGDFENSLSSGDAYLTAISVRRLRLLRDLGYAVPPGVLASAIRGLRGSLMSESAQAGTSEFRTSEIGSSVVAALPGDQPIDDHSVERLWNTRTDTSWFARADLTRALGMRKRYADKAAILRDELLTAGTLRANRRVILPDHALSWWPFEFVLRDQCAVIDTLTAIDDSTDGKRVRNQLVRGLSDLYAGGAPTSDTQALSTCLVALMHVSQSLSQDDNTPLTIAASAGSHASRIRLSANQRSASWSTDLSAGASKFNLRLEGGNAPFASFVANVEYDEDGRRAKRAAVGYSIERRYAVLRNHHWQDVPHASIHEGDWVRVTLRVVNLATRRFVAVSDPVAGGLRPTDLSLAGVSGLELRSLAGYDDPLFDSRQVDDRFARFYAETLPPGTHEIHYYARAAHAGNYAALPATAELMYGAASRARTAATRVVILSASAGAGHDAR